jgi:hypothetical protein
MAQFLYRTPARSNFISNYSNLMPGECFDQITLLLRIPGCMRLILDKAKLAYR